MRRTAAALVLVAGILPPAKRQTLSVKALVYCLILVFIHSGCATSPKSPTPPSPEERATFGTVGVARAYHHPEMKVYAAYAKGQAVGAAKGAGTYFGGVLLEGLFHIAFPQDPISAAVYLVLVGAVAVVSLPVGAVVGAVKALPGGEVASCERLLREILERVSPQEDLQDELMRAGAETTEQRLVPVDEVGPTIIDNVAAYDSLAGKGIHTVLEVSLERISLGASETGGDPPLVLAMSARSRLIRLGDKTILNENRFEHSSDSRKFAEWAADNAAILDKEYEDGVREIALAIISWNFGSRIVTKENGTEWDADSIVSPPE